MEGTQLRLRFVTEDGERLERTRAFADSDLAERELAQLVEEQVKDGFVEVSTPVWRRFVDQLVESWNQDDPGFDADGLRRRLLASSAPSAAEIVEHVIGLGERCVTRADGSSVVDLDRALDNPHRNWLKRHATESLPALLLALRHPDMSAQMQVDAILGGLRSQEAVPAFMSVLEHPAPNLAFHLGGRPQHFPHHALTQLGPPDPETTSRLASALDHADFRIANAASKVLAEFANEDRCFKPLFAHVERGKRDEGFAWSIMRAAEVRRDPALLLFLQWMAASGRFRSAGYPERIRAAIAGLKAGA